MDAILLRKQGVCLDYSAIFNDYYDIMEAFKHSSYSMEDGTMKDAP